MESSTSFSASTCFTRATANLHPLILFDANDRDQFRRCELFGAEILEASLKLGGTVTGSMGWRREKLNSMCVQFSAASSSSSLP